MLIKYDWSEFIFQKEVAKHDLITFWGHFFGTPPEDIMPYEEIEPDRDNVLYYEYERFDEGFQVWTVLHMLGSIWQPYYTKNSNLKLAIDFEDAFKISIVIALYEPIDVNISDWVLIRDGSVYRVKEKYLDDGFDIWEDSQVFLSPEEVGELLQ